MAAITVAAENGGMTMAAASGGGDTVAAVPGEFGGWAGQGTVALVVTVGATPTTVTVDGVAKGSLTSQTAVYPLSAGVYPRSVAVTYNQVTSVTVGAVVL